MKIEARLSQWQVTAYIVSLILPTAILFVPAFTARSAGPDAWLSLLLALSFGLLVACAASGLATRYPEETVIEYAPKLMGKILGKTVGFIYAFYFYYVAYFVQRQFGDLMTSVYMIDTPMQLQIFILTLVACYALYLGIEPLCRTNSIIVFLLLGSIVFMFIVILKNIHYENFVPMLATPWKRIAYGALSPASWFGECAVILMLAPFLAERSKTATATLYSVLIVFISMLIVTAGAIGVFGPDVTARMVFPTFSLARETQLEAAVVLERIDVLFMAVWVAGMAFKLITFFYAGTLAFAQLFGIPSYRVLIIPGGILLMVLSLNSWDNIAGLLEFSALVFPTSISFVNFLLTTLLLLLSFRHSNKKVKPAARR